VEVEWVWPAATPDVELVVRRDALLEALPDGEGTIRFDGLDKQLVIESAAGERRLALANRPRRRKPVASRVAFGRLRLAVEAHDERVALGLAAGRPLTVESDAVRAVLSPMAPAPRGPRTAPAAAKPGRAAGAAAARAGERDARRREAERREAERQRAEERRHAEEARRGAQAARRAAQALERAVAQLDAAARALADSPLADAAPMLEELRERVRDAADTIGGRG
jgi:hypothetical protein